MLYPIELRSRASESTVYTLTAPVGLHIGCTFAQVSKIVRAYLRWVGSHKAQSTRIVSVNRRRIGSAGHDLMVLTWELTGSSELKIRDHDGTPP